MTYFSDSVAMDGTDESNAQVSGQFVNATGATPSWSIARTVEITLICVPVLNTCNKNKPVFPS